MLPNFFMQFMLSMAEPSFKKAFDHDFKSSGSAKACPPMSIPTSQCLTTAAATRFFTVTALTANPAPQTTPSSCLSNPDTGSLL